MKMITIQVPDDSEIQIVRKGHIIKTYQDLIDSKIKISGYWINGKSDVCNYNTEIVASVVTKDIAFSEKVAKSMLAMAMISQLMPYYGGEITSEEWRDVKIDKYTIERNTIKDSQIGYDTHQYWYHFLAFHTKEQRDKFFKYNEQLVKDYLMID